MKISTNTWHRKLNQFTYGDGPFETYNGKQINTNLCKYFWRTVCSILLLPLILGWRYLIPESFQIEHRDMTVVIAILFGIGLVAALATGIWFLVFAPPAIIGVFAGFVYLGFVIIDKYKERKSAHPYKPSIFKEYIKAKKNKYCPIVEWEEQ